MTAFVTCTCCQCKEAFGLAAETHATLKRSQQTFHCPWGHQNYYPLGPTEADKLRQERDRLKQDAARLQESINYQREQREAAERRASAMKGQVTRLKNRAAAGICPCCNRTFQQLARHMAAKHPAFRSEEAASTEGQTIQ